MTRAGCILLLLASGCLFLPNVEEHGYTQCKGDEECAAGRYCQAALCAPPLWNDDAFGARRLLVVESTGAIPAGAAVPVRIGVGGAFDSGDLGPDGRFTHFAPRGELGGTWREIEAFFDLYNDHVIAWLPLQEAVDDSAVQLGWVETNTGANDATRTAADPSALFTAFDDFEGAALGDNYVVFGGDPQVQDSQVTVGDNQRVLLAEGIAPPFSLTFRGRINGAACDNFFLGLEGDDRASYSAPSIGLLATGALVAVLEVAPNEDAVPRPVVEGLALDTAEHRYRFDVGGGQVKLFIDDDEVAAPLINPGIEAERLFPVVDVDGDCSFSVERLMVSPLPPQGVTVRAEDEVAFQIFE